MGSQFKEAHKMFYSFETAREDQEAAEEAARNEAALYEANNAFDFENETAGWDYDEDLTPSQNRANEAEAKYGEGFKNAEFTPNPDFAA
jgi:hypothetical protein